MKTNLEEHIKFRKSLISTARAIIANQVAIPLGALRITNLKFRAASSGAFGRIDLELFEEYVQQFNGCPIGTERLLWEKEALKEQDVHLDQITRMHKNKIIDKCFEILNLSI